jgi:hypothetical protein
MTSFEQKGDRGMTFKEQLSKIKVNRVYLVKGVHWQFEMVLEQLVTT